MGPRVLGGFFFTRKERGMAGSAGELGVPVVSPTVSLRVPAGATRPPGLISMGSPPGSPGANRCPRAGLGLGTMTVVGTAPSPTLARPPYTSLDGIPLPTASPWVFPLG